MADPKYRNYTECTRRGRN
ncbi:hypothetical protein PENFLA_c032G03825 [Penicillium flavigenum]|uniref:Uncharacterized protein n=1 Tax=Penicillium flavigenum TaxID=254877 RepID=A0A1V6SMS0_9EURO|nr:hypothetical protein PENFLA_c032G03825 [Penicillium flavigenum]